VTTILHTSHNFGSLYLQEIIQRTGYSHEVTPGQRKYGGPPPGWNGSPPGPGHEVKCLNSEITIKTLLYITYNSLESLELFKSVLHVCLI